MMDGKADKIKSYHTTPTQLEFVVSKPALPLVTSKIIR
jgi:hypothetical protein